MTTMIDRVGVYRGYVAEHGVGATKNNLPKWTGRLTATQRWVDEKDLMEHFGLTEPGWVDWSEYDQEITAYLVLFSNKNDKLKPIWHYENLKKAFGWDGASFSALAGMDLSGKLVTYWVDENEYEGSVSLQVSNLEDGEADAVRSLRTLDAEGLKNLDNQFAQVLAGKKTAAKAAPAAAPAKAPTAGKLPAKAVASAPSKAAPSPTMTASPAAAPAAKKGPPKAPPKKAAEPAPFETTSVPAMDMGKAWEYLLANKGIASDDDAVEAWQTAAGAVAPGKEQDAFTNEEWSQVATAAVAACQQKAAA